MRRLRVFDTLGPKPTVGRRGCCIAAFSKAAIRGVTQQNTGRHGCDADTGHPSRRTESQQQPLFVSGQNHKFLWVEHQNRHATDENRVVRPQNDRQVQDQRIAPHPFQPHQQGGNKPYGDCGFPGRQPVSPLGSQHRLGFFLSEIAMRPFDCSIHEGLQVGRGAGFSAAQSHHAATGWRHFFVQVRSRRHGWSRRWQRGGS